MKTNQDVFTHLESLYSKGMDLLLNLGTLIDRLNVQGCDERLIAESFKLTAQIREANADFHYRQNTLRSKIINEGKLLDEASPEVLNLEELAVSFYERDAVKLVEEQENKLNQMVISDTSAEHSSEAPITCGMVYARLHRLVSRGVFTLITSIYNLSVEDLMENIPADIYDQDLADEARKVTQNLMKTLLAGKQAFKKLFYNFRTADYDKKFNPEDLQYVVALEEAAEEYLRVKNDIKARKQQRQIASLQERMRSYATTESQEVSVDEEDQEEEKIPSDMSYEEFSDRLSKLADDFNSSTEPNSSLSAIFSKWFKEDFGKDINDQAENISIEDLVEEVLDNAQEYISSSQFVDLTIWGITLSTLDDIIDELNNHNSVLSESEDKVVSLEEATQLEVAEKLWARLKKGPKVFAEAEQLKESKAPKRAKAKKEVKSAPQEKPIKDMGLEEVTEAEQDLLKKMQYLKSRKQRLITEESYATRIQAVFDEALFLTSSAQLKNALVKAKEELSAMIEAVEQMEDLQPEDVAELKEMLITKFNEFAEQITQKATQLLTEEMGALLLNPTNKKR